MPKNLEPVTAEVLRRHARLHQAEIRQRLNDFAQLRTASDAELFGELVFCIFTAGASARMGLRSVEAVKPLLEKGTVTEIENALVGKHRYPRARAAYIVTTRAFLEREHQMRLREHLEAFGRDREARRDWLARTREIKGLGYKEASHFLRNTGFRGYAILDKHILNSMYELGAIDAPVAPTTRRRYLEIEARLKRLSETLKIDFDELDLVLWSWKTGEILK